MRTIVLVAALAATACTPTTYFKGDPYVQGGAKGCEAKCQQWGLDFAGMVAIGEYSDACICLRPGAPTARAAAEAATIAATAGVRMQMTRQEEARHQLPGH